METFGSERGDFLSCAFYYICEVKPGSLTKRCKTLNVSHGQRCLLKATPALYDNEMENNISLRIRQLFAVRLAEECRIFLATASAEVRLGMTLKFRSAVHL